MSGVTQTIPSYGTGGISEQPDHQKFPGQVKNVTNAIPDITYGLFKRPGSKRVGTAPLASVGSGGSWFHYYRDETEGSYIGQVLADGTLNVWRCSDGTKMTTVYGTGGETAIKTYLSASNTEDLQFLTINDTTFVNNRDTTVTTTGTTDTTPHAYFAYIDLLRVQNGRQYGLNVYDDNTTTNIARATRCKIGSDTLDETNGSGTCPGIGTQVFKVDSGSSKNLIFRITTVGQQNSINPDSNTYSCTYNRKVDLLHGGEYWATGNVPAVTLDSAKTSFNYTINIEKIETVVVKANIKAVRPEPTPFDAHTAATPDTVLGGIMSELGQLSGQTKVQASGADITATIIGNGIYLSCANDFNVEVCEPDLMRVMQGSVQSVSDLPGQCKNGYIVKVSNAQESDEDDYYLKFEGENGKDGAGSWVECAEPSIVKSLVASTMPHVIQRTAATTFTVKQFTYPDREVGDDVTNPIPNFVGKKINKVLFFRNRLALLAGEYVTTCRPGTLGAPNFWANTALAVSNIDPINISSSSMFPSDLYDGIEIAAGLLVFSSNQQFLLSSDDTLLNPDTAKLRSVSTYNYSIDIPPISLGTTVGYIDNSGLYSRFNEMANTSREGEPIVVETSRLVPSLLPRDIDLITNSRENSLILFSKTGSNEVIGYKYFVVGDKRPQSSWFRWKLNREIKYHFIVDDVYYFLDEDNFLQSINIIQSSTDPSINQDGINYLIHLDNYTTVSGGTYNSVTKLTTFANQSDWIDQVTNPNNTNGTLVVVDTDTNASRVGRYAVCTVINSDDFTVPGDWSSATLNIGYVYEYSVEFPRIFVGRQEGNRFKSDTNGSLILHRLHLNFGKIGLYETTLNRTGKVDYTDVHESTNLNTYNVSDAPYLEEEIKTIPVYEKNSNVDVILKSSHPAPATLHSMSWEGDYTSKYYRRV